MNDLSQELFAQLSEEVDGDVSRALEVEPNLVVSNLLVDVLHAVLH